jgi:hypothetical protein
VEDIFEAVQGHTVIKFDDSSSSSMSDSSPHTGYYNFLLRSTSATRWKKDNYPLPSQMLFLWQIYTENIDPFIKILHKPTVTKVIQEIRTSYDSLDTSMRTLVLAISFAAIMSLEDEEASFPFGHRIFLSLNHSNTGQSNLQHRERPAHSSVSTWYRAGTGASRHSQPS